MCRTLHNFCCVIIGEGSLPLQCAEFLLQQGHTIAGIVALDPQLQACARRQHLPCCSQIDALPTLLEEAQIDYLLSGVQPPTPEWGAMLNEGRPYLQEAPWIATFPGLAILFTVICFNLLGDGVRDAFDPRQHRS